MAPIYQEEVSAWQTTAVKPHESMCIRYIISSHIRFYEHTLPMLLPSMIDRNGIDPADIFVAVGGAERNYDEIRDGTTYLFVEHNSFDYTGMIEVTERGIPADWWFWLHDTCECGPRFKELAEGSFDTAADKSAACPNAFGMAICNIGIYRNGWLQKKSVRDYLSQLKNLTKKSALKHEGVLYSLLRGTKSVYPNARLIHMEEVQVYGTDIWRKKLYFRSIDLYKYQANWKPSLDDQYAVDP